MLYNSSTCDVFAVDRALPLRIQNMLQNALLVVTSLVVISFVFPLFLLPLIPMAIVFYMLYRYVYIYQILRSRLSSSRAIFAVLPHYHLDWYISRLFQNFSRCFARNETSGFGEQISVDQPHHDHHARLADDRCVQCTRTLHKNVKPASDNSPFAMHALNLSCSQTIVAYLTTCT